MKETYKLLDSGNGKKFETFGSYHLVRPAAHAIWEPKLSQKEWRTADGEFTREGGYRWVKKISDDWIVTIGGLTFKLAVTDFGHIGVFPEQKEQWQWIEETVALRKAKGREVSVLNLFAYSGGATLAAARAGAKVCHLDASKGMVAWARENASLNKLDDRPIRWIVDDVRKFLERELRRGNRYDGIILDPPTYGRGSRGEVFKVEEDVLELLKTCRELLSDNPLFLTMSSHTPLFTPLLLQRVLERIFNESITSGEMLLDGDLPNGTFARWRRV